MANSQKAHLMKTLHISEKEADELLAYDEAVNKGKKTKYDLTKEQEKETRKYRQCDRKPTIYNFDTSKRQRKPNETKGGLVAELHKFLSENSNFAIENCEITNKERQIAFKCGENRYELTLVQKRPPKN